MMFKKMKINRMTVLQYKLMQYKYFCGIVSVLAFAGVALVSVAWANEAKPVTEKNYQLPYSRKDAVFFWWTLHATH